MAPSAPAVEEPSAPTTAAPAVAIPPVEIVIAPAAAEEIPSDAPGSVRGPSTVGIQYVSAEGTFTERRITIVSLDDPNFPSDPPMIYAYCHLRGEMRHFRTDRIVSLFDPDTGEALRHEDLAEDPSAQRFDPERRIRGGRIFGPETFDDAERLHREEWEKMGWRIQRRSENWGDAFEFYRPNRKGDDWLSSPEIAVVWLRRTHSRFDPKTGLRKVSYAEFRKTIELRVKRRGVAPYSSCSEAFHEAKQIIAELAPIRRDA